MQLTIHTIDTAPDESRPIMDGIAADLGLVPNLAATAAGSPALLTAFDSVRRAVASTRLDPVLREVAGLATGVAIDNRYGVAFHSTMLATLGMDEGDIEAMREGDPPAREPAATVHQFARDLVLGRGKVADAMAVRVTSAGLDGEAILEILLECVFASLVGMVDNLAGHVQLDDFLGPRAWDG